MGVFLVQSTSVLIKYTSRTSTGRLGSSLGQSVCVWGGGGGLWWMLALQSVFSGTLWCSGISRLALPRLGRVIMS